MNKKRIILFAVLVIFVVGMTMSRATAKTFTLKPKKDKYVSKKSGKYTVEVLKWKAYTYQEVDIFAYKNGKMMKKNKYASKVYYKENGKLKKTPWFKGSQAAVYHKMHFSKSHKIQKVKVRV